MLVTGAFGQIGSDLVPELVKRYGRERVVCMAHKKVPASFDGVVVQGDCRDEVFMRRVVKDHNINTIYHLASLLSATGEADPQGCFDLNVGSLRLVLELARELKLRVFWASSIAVFGPSTPKLAPQSTILEPSSMYGITKVTGELLCSYYHRRYNVDVRSLRYPGLISWKEEPGGGTTDFSVAFYYAYANNVPYECYLNQHSALPLMYMPDAIRATMMLMDAPDAAVKVRTSYNLGALSLCAAQIEQELKHRNASFVATYKEDPVRQGIANSWPSQVDDSQARSDWGWNHLYDLKTMSDDMIESLKQKFSNK